MLVAYCFGNCSGLGSQETVGIFYDSTISQLEFAAGDIETSLENEGFKVELLPASAFNRKYAHKKLCFHWPLIEV